MVGKKKTKRRGAGRPKGARNKRTLALEEFCRRVAEEGVAITIRERILDQRGRDTGKVEEKTEEFLPLLYRVVQDAHAGNNTAQKLILAYGFGLPVETKRLQGKVSVAGIVAEFAQQAAEMPQDQLQKEAMHYQKLGAKVIQFRAAPKKRK